MLRNCRDEHLRYLPYIIIIIMRIIIIIIPIPNRVNLHVERISRSDPFPVLQVEILLVIHGA